MEFSKGRERNNVMTLPNGETIRLDEKGNVEVLHEQSQLNTVSEPAQQERSNGPSVRFSMKIEGEGQLGEIVGLMSNNASQAISRQSENFYDPEPYMRPSFAENEDSRTAYMTLDDEKDMQSPQKAPSIRRQEENIDEAIIESQKKKKHRRTLLVGGAVVALLLAGPAIQAANGSQVAAKKCGANPICATNEFTGYFSPKNIFNFIPQEHK